MFLSTLTYVISIIILVSFSGNLFRHYLRTRFYPSLFLMLIGMFLGLSYLIYLPLTWFPSSTSLDVINRYFNVILRLMIIVMGFDTLFLEGIYKRMFSWLSIFHFIYIFYIFGYISHQKWEYYYVDGIGFFQRLDPITTILLSINILIMLFMNIWRFSFYLKQSIKEQKLNKITLIIWIIGFPIAILGGIYATIQPDNVFQPFFVISGFILIFFAYRYKPKSFFLLNAEISQIIIMNLDSGMEFLSIGTSFPMASEGIFGSMLIQREIFKTNKNLREINFEDAFMFMNVIPFHSKKIAAAIIARRETLGLKSSLKFMLKRFIHKYGDLILKETPEIGLYEAFKKDIYSIFDYALENPLD